MRQFTIIAWKGNAAFVRDGKSWLKLADAEAKYNEVRSDFLKLTANRVNDEFDTIELHALANPVKGRKLISSADAKRAPAAPLKAPAPEPKISVQPPKKKS